MTVDDLVDRAVPAVHDDELRRRPSAASFTGVAVDWVRSTSRYTSPASERTARSVTVAVIDVACRFTISRPRTGFRLAAA